MRNNSDIHHHPFEHDQGRRSIRLKGYDYTQPGAYFITICTANRGCLFGEVVKGNMQLNPLGNIARQCWLAIPDHFPHTALDEFIIMPNHVHGIVWIVEKPDDDNVGAKNNVGANVYSPPVGAKNFSPLQSPQQFNDQPRGTSKTIGSIVRGFKIGVTKWARKHTDIHTVWQRNYYEHIIRNDEELYRIREYIINNPTQWAMDRENPGNVRMNDSIGANNHSPLQKDEPWRI